MKPLIFIEETDLKHTVRPVDLLKGDQFSKAFTRISPNQRIPAVIDRVPKDGGAPVTIFESGTILAYFAEKIGVFNPKALRGRTDVTQWLFWQIRGLGPTRGQFLHFSMTTDEANPYAQRRFGREKERLYRVLIEQLRVRNFISGNCSIANMAVYPCIRALERAGNHLNGFSHIGRWYETMSERRAVVRANERAATIATPPFTTEAS